MQCEICGKEIAESSYMNAVLCSSKCFERHYWQQIIAEKDKHIIIHGCCYCDGGNVEQPSRYGFLGFSGRRFWIRFFDGQMLSTNNLWMQGDIPSEYRSALPDNAEFCTPRHLQFQ